ncbi:hypothetical protein GUITHDRAFT_133202 [Guillardia theta CCMP2712]|uniref:Uncharacterized protein n=1 Tax=Guillardia theta (strain CCMP2712) TaxID=905079 RepID=L1JZG6_GUITC|nr:hypothetical protein GUITHDRAFT_133202 [Guillardia theta CCMP2712]EKX53503.1 hypothetical protein GUITHDRAFT_133202 [Guillardia theta CCMP2712]|eukprot:XP_005840483.1 hypothetical protein GUITHDRAFT_133202 [Guillardia theta CCMP2712]
MAVAVKGTTEKLAEAAKERKEMAESFEPFSLSHETSAEGVKGYDQGGEDCDELKHAFTTHRARDVQNEFVVSKGSQVCVKWDKKWSPETDGWSAGVVLEVSDGKVKNPNGRGLVTRGWSLVLYEGRDVHIHLLDRDHHVNIRGNRKFAWKLNEENCSIDLTELNQRNVIQRYQGKRKFRSRTRHFKSKHRKARETLHHVDEKENAYLGQNTEQQSGKSFASSEDSMATFGELNQTLADSETHSQENIYDIARKVGDNEDSLASEESMAWVLETSDIQPHNLASLSGDSMCDCSTCTGKNSHEKIAAKDPISDLL